MEAAGRPEAAPPHEGAAVWEPGQGGGAAKLANGLVCTSRTSLERHTIEYLNLARLGVFETIYNTDRKLMEIGGGQARGFIAKWKEPPGNPRAGVIPEGELVAIKQVLSPLGGGDFKAIQNESEFKRARELGDKGLHMELNIVGLLHMTGCGSRVVKPLAYLAWPGEWFEDAEKREKMCWEPMYAYVLKGYPRSSVTHLLKDLCHRRLPECAAQYYLGMDVLASEYHTLLSELHKIHHTEGVQLMLQDLTPGNILVDDTGPDGVRLLFSDPAMALPIQVLNQRPPPQRGILTTWQWGSALARLRRFDPKADLYSLSYIFAEMWLVAEGVAIPPTELIMAHRIDHDKVRGVQFMRTLIIEGLRNQLHGNHGRPRIDRQQPVSWFGAWLLLLGLRDFVTEEQLWTCPCLRPEETEMLDVAKQWRDIAAAAEKLPSTLSKEEAESEAHRPLVDDMCTPLTRLLALSRLDDAQQQDPNLAWLAANFMAQKHPLVAAMRAQGAKGAGQAEERRGGAGWNEAVNRAMHKCGHVADAETYQEKADQLRREVAKERQEMAQERLAVEKEKEEAAQLRREKEALQQACQVYKRYLESKLQPGDLAACLAEVAAACGPPGAEVPAPAPAAAAPLPPAPPAPRGPAPAVAQAADLALQEAAASLQKLLADSSGQEHGAAEPNIDVFASAGPAAAASFSWQPSGMLSMADLKLERGWTLHSQEQLCQVQERVQPLTAPAASPAAAAATAGATAALAVASGSQQSSLHQLPADSSPAPPKPAVSGEPSVCSPASRPGGARVNKRPASPAATPAGEPAAGERSTVKRQRRKLSVMQAPVWQAKHLPFQPTGCHDYRQAVEHQPTSSALPHCHPAKI